MSSFSLYTLLTLTFSFYLYSALALEPGDYYIYVDAANRALGTAHETGSIVEMLPLGAPLQHWHLNPVGFGDTYNITHGEDYPHSVDGLVQLVYFNYTTWDIVPIVQDSPLPSANNLFYIVTSESGKPKWQIPFFSNDINNIPVFLGKQVGTVFRIEPIF